MKSSTSKKGGQDHHGEPLPWLLELFFSFSARFPSQIFPYKPIKRGCCSPGARSHESRTSRALFLFHELLQAANWGGKHKFRGLVLLQSPPKTHFWEFFLRLKGKHACPRSLPGRSPWDGLSQEVSPCTELHKIPQKEVLQGV